MSQFAGRAGYVGIKLGSLGREIDRLDRATQEWVLDRAAKGGLTIAEVVRDCIVVARAAERGEKK